MLHLSEFPASTLLCKEGELGDRMFILLDGSVEVIQAFGTMDEHILNILYPGEYFGEMSFILNETRSATIRSIGKSVIEVIPVQEGGLEKLIHENPDIADKIITGLAQRLKQANLMLVK